MLKMQSIVVSESSVHFTTFNSKCKKQVNFNFNPRKIEKPIFKDVYTIDKTLENGLEVHTIIS